MDEGNAHSRRYIRQVVSRFEEVVCESTIFELYGSKARRAKDVYQMLHPVLKDEAVEVFVALLLDVQNGVTGLVEVSRGTLTSSLVHPREVFGPALRLGAAAVIVSHNHPSGDPDPSIADKEVTRRLLEAGKLLGVPLLDHVVLGSEGRFCSLRTVLDFS